MNSVKSARLSRLGRSARVSQLVHLTGNAFGIQLRLRADAPWMIAQRRGSKINAWMEIVRGLKTVNHDAILVIQDKSALRLRILMIQSGFCCRRISDSCLAEYSRYMHYPL